MPTPRALAVPTTAASRPDLQTIVELIRRVDKEEPVERIEATLKLDPTLAFKLNLPPSYLLIHRVWIGGMAVLSQLETKAPFRSVLEELLPGFTETADHQ